VSPDGLAPYRGAFRHALDFAARLRLPLHGVSNRNGVADFSSRSRDAGTQLLEEACSRFNVTWIPDQSRTLGGDRLSAFVGNDDLFFLGRALSMEVKTWLGARLGQTGPSFLLCPDEWTPLTRLLLLDEGTLSVDNFCNVAALLCHRLGASPVVLTLGRSFYAARHRQDDLRHSCGIDAEFDLLASVSGQDAVANIARWRHCQLVAVPHCDSQPWWSWRRRHFLNWGLDMSASLAFLVLSEPQSPRAWTAMPSLRWRLKRRALGWKGRRGGRWTERLV
jgi:hypothetical protein